MKSLLFLTVGITMVMTGCATTRTYTPEETAYMEKAAACPLSFPISKDKAEEAWSRVHTFIAQFSSMKIQTATDYTITTYTPTQRGTIEIYYGYSATRTLMGDEVKISVQCFSNNPYAQGQMSHNAHLFAYYVKTGEVMPQLVNR